MTDIRFRTVDVGGTNLFYREAGTPGTPTLLLLHGFPTSSHMFRALIPKLADRYHLIAPDLPDVGRSDLPKANRFEFLAESMARFTELVGLDRFAVYVFDFGAPTGFRLARNHPVRITAIISQNGNAYEEGLSDDWNPMRVYRQEASTANQRQAADAFDQRHDLTGSTRMECPIPSGFRRMVIRSTCTISSARASQDVQLDLFGDYRTNVELYPAFQEYFRTHRPPVYGDLGPK